MHYSQIFTLFPLQQSTFPKFIQLQGRHLVAQYWYNKVQTVPDIAYTLLNSKVHTWSNTECSKVVGNFTISATRLYDVPHATLMMVGSEKGIGVSGGEQQKGNSNSSNDSKTCPVGGEVVTTSANNNSSAKGGRKRGKSSGSNDSNSRSMPDPSAVIDSNTVVVTTPNGTTTDSNGIRDDIRAYLQSVPMLTEPVVLSCAVKLILHLDAHKLIQRMEFHCSPRIKAPLEIKYN